MYSKDLLERLLKNCLLSWKVLSVLFKVFLVKLLGVVAELSIYEF